MDLVQAFLVAFGVIFVAELGDKSQLMALAFAARYRPFPVLAGIALGAAAMFALSVAVGAVLGVALPTRAINVAAGVAFLFMVSGRAVTPSDMKGLSTSGR